MKINMDGLWFIIDKRFRVTSFPDEGYQSKKEAQDELNSWEGRGSVDIKNYRVDDFYDVQHDIIDNANFDEDAY